MQISSKEKIFIFLCTFFTSMLVLNNLTYQKFVSLDLKFHVFELSAGAVLYPLTFLITDLIAEFYGKERANFCVNLALIINIISAIIVYGMDMMPAASWSKIDSETFHNVFGFFAIAFSASLIACFVAQKLDVIIYLYLKEFTGGSLLWIRNLGSTAISLIVDTTIVVIVLTIFGILPHEQMIMLIIDSYSWKLFFTILSAPLFYLFVGLIRKLI